MDSVIELPKKVAAATQEVPGSLILFGLPKCGKTDMISKLSGCLNIDVEKGSNFVEMLKIQPPDDLGPVGQFQWIKHVARQIKEQNRPYDFVAIDTLSYLDELSEWVGTYDYMNSPQGKSFNRVNNVKGGEFLDPDDPAYQSVHTLADGNGYQYSRAAMKRLFAELKGLGKICTIFVCHVKDKYVISKQGNQEVRTIDLALTGKVRDILARDVDALGYVWNEKGKLQVSFEGNEERLGGMRGSKHIQGYKGELDWNMIFKLNKQTDK